MMEHEPLADEVYLSVYLYWKSVLITSTSLCISAASIHLPKGKKPWYSIVGSFSAGW
jgi:hypothetical protein